MVHLCKSIEDGIMSYRDDGYSKVAMKKYAKVALQGIPVYFLCIVF